MNFPTSAELIKTNGFDVQDLYRIRFRLLRRHRHNQTLIIHVTGNQYLGSIRRVVPGYLVGVTGGVGGVAYIDVMMMNVYGRIIYIIGFKTFNDGLSKDGEI